MNNYPYKPTNGSESSRRNAKLKLDDTYWRQRAVKAEKELSDLRHDMAMLLVSE